nr:MAG TPA: hypothetical protein [Caudoviricetes sp.]
MLACYRRWVSATSIRLVSGRLKSLGPLCRRLFCCHEEALYLWSIHRTDQIILM